MNIAGSKVLLTGAAGGIGRCIALGLAQRGATVALVGRSAAPLEALAEEVRHAGRPGVVLPFDLAQPDGHADLVQRAAHALGGLDAVINNAAVSRFQPYGDTDAAAIRQMIAINVTAPMLITHAALPRFRHQGHGRVLNVGSAFGAIAFAHFTAYSATKFALRGFSEALRRELSGTDIKVIYVAPRATATGMNGPGVRALYAQTGTAVDAPERVAAIVLAALARDSCEVHIGWPERFFVRLNALLPRLVDRALAAQTRLAERCAGAETGRGE